MARRISNVTVEQVAAILKEHRPDSKGGTIGERRVWARVTRSLGELLSAYVPGCDLQEFYSSCDYQGEGL